MAGGNEPDSYDLNGVNILPVLQGDDLDYKPSKLFLLFFDQPSGC